MNQILLPTDTEFVETVARSIAKDRLYREASIELSKMVGVAVDTSPLEGTFDRVFDIMWSGTTDHDEMQKEGYRNDARAAISAINLKLLTS